MNPALVHIYCGDGKGKTTCAVGLATRACGRGKKVLWTSFLKDYDSGEFLADHAFDLYPGEAVHQFYFTMTDEEKKEVVKEHRARLDAVFTKAAKEGYELLILDETMASLDLGILELSHLMTLLKNRPDCLEVVMTGRNPPQELIDFADYVSEIKAVKHPYDKGIPARVGIDK